MNKKLKPFLDTFSILFIILALQMLAMSVSFWKIFEKAGIRGWKALIPGYNIFCYLRIVRCPTWWIIFFLLPVASWFAPVLIQGKIWAVMISSLIANSLAFIVIIYTFSKLKKYFRLNGGFFLGLIFLPMIFILVLAFSDASYEPAKKRRRF